MEDPNNPNNPPSPSPAEPKPKKKSRRYRPRREKFIIEYAKTGNGVQSVLAAGHNVASQQAANKQVERYLADPETVQAVREIVKKRHPDLAVKTADLIAMAYEVAEESRKMSDIRTAVELGQRMMGWEPTRQSESKIAVGKPSDWLKKKTPK